MQVTDSAGNELSFLRALGRNLGKILSSITLAVGYMMAGFTKKKQALHDIMASCLVVRTKQVPLVQIIGGALGGIVLHSVSGYFDGSVSSSFDLSSLGGSSSGIQQSTQPDLPIEGEPSGTSDPTEAPVDEPVDDTPKIPTAPSITSGTISGPGRTVALRDSLALYFPNEERLEVAFFGEQVSEAQKQQVFEIDSLEKLEGNTPDFLATFWLRRGTSFCSPGAVQRFDVKVNEREGGIMRPATFAFGAQKGGIGELSCRLEHGAPLTAEFSQSLFDRVRDESYEYRWEARSSGPVYVSQQTAEFVFSSNDQHPVAIWNKETRELEIGFFDEKLSADEREEVRKAKSLFAVEQKKPGARVSFEVNKKYNSFEKNALRSFGIHFYRSPLNDGVGPTFPGEKDITSFYFVVTTERTEQLARLVGHLYEGDVIQGSMRDEQTKQFDHGDVTFKWELVFAPHVIDVFAEAMASIEEIASAPEDSEPPKGISATIEAGKAKLELVDAVALWYVDEFDLVVGFYPEKLTAAERAKVARNKSVWSAVNAKKPNFVMYFDLIHGKSDFSKANVSSFSMSFVRDKLGEFYFPGKLDRATIKRLHAEIKEGDLKYFSGSGSETTGTLSIRSKGDHASKKNGLYFTWAIEAAMPVVPSQ